MSQRLSLYSIGASKASRARVSHVSNIIRNTAESAGPTKHAQCARPVSSQVSARASELQSQGSSDIAHSANTVISHRARQKQADREFFASLLSSATTKRDSKAYISRLKEPTKVRTSQSSTSPSRSQVNLGDLFGNPRSVERSPVFTQYEPEQQAFKEEELLHVALVKLSDLEQVPDNVVVGIAETLCQLARLSMSPCVVMDSSCSSNGDRRQKVQLQANRLATAIDAMTCGGARLIEDIFSIAEVGDMKVTLKKLLMTPLRRGLIPIILPTAYSEQEQKVIPVSADQAILALTKDFAGLSHRQDQSAHQSDQKQISLDRVIVIDPAGGIPNSASADGNHVFINMEQEYLAISKALEDENSNSSARHLRHLSMLRQVLDCLPSSASGLIATPEEAANMSQVEHESSLPLVGTRRQKNALIHNMLTDKPAYSSSLPKGRLSKVPGSVFPSRAATFVKQGMSIKMLPDPIVQPWTPVTPRIKLTDAQIDLNRLVYLINDSFNRELDVESYLKRVNDCIAGVIIAGDYEGGAILTWENPPGGDPNNPDRLVPYLDKFAVLKRSQGAGGVADMLFNAMVRTCFPNGVCWRSRKDNPVNKWYFERSRGTKKIPDMNWTMFWTTPGVVEDSQRFQDYEGVCRNVEPTWLNKKIAAD